MELIILSNAITPHQRPICESFNSLLDGRFRFIETCPIEKEKLPEGWKELTKNDYVISYNEFNRKRDYFEKCILEASVVILGAASDKLIVERLKSGKLTFRYSERFYKEGFSIKRYPRNAISAWLHHGQYQRYPLYMLCASAYTAADCARFGNYKGRCYKWGYFPTFEKVNNISDLLESKVDNTILWAGRFLNWKHPEHVIEVAKKLRDDGYEYKVTMLGDGELYTPLKLRVEEERLESNIAFVGTVPASEVREYMYRSQILLFTSDYYEGWGATLNEAMNSGCCVVGSHAIGSVPYLIQDNINGLIYSNGNIDELHDKVRSIIDSKEKLKSLAKAAYQTIAEKWNAEKAANNFMVLCQSLSGNHEVLIDKDEPCSLAEVLPNDWYKSI